MSPPYKTGIQLIDSLDFDSVEDEFDIDLCDTARVSHFSPTYYKLSSSESDELFESLRSKHRSKSVTFVKMLLENMKLSSNEPSISQTYEHLVRNSLECPGYIRGGGDEVQDIDDTCYPVFKDLYRVTQAFLKNNQHDELQLSRGMYPEEFCEVISGLMEEPTNEAIELHSPVVTSYSLSEEKAKKCTEGVIATLSISPRPVAFAHDFLLSPPKHTGPEGEVHVLSYDLIVPSEALRIHFGRDDYGDAPRSLPRTIQNMSTPSTLTSVQHHDIENLFRLLFKIDNSECQNSLRVLDPDANSRAWTWYDYAESKNLVEEQELTKKYTEYLFGPKDAE
ncbi:hypothetical protein EKH57_18015 (plasmid) [Halorubrum sp. BOL3-1]|uniref:hypothetical protein n=1 Tax=Halorubrum sp. BOL3-1 TaxID=2497325 RepID=UPI001004E559|nr:hypothetical protein [Halorubrum sp. BOL3-1]QAU14566.1 hypothetical protein EKH57_18015 [Halorubrum sp. BOL3-1]